MKERKNKEDSPPVWYNNDATDKEKAKTRAMLIEAAPAFERLKLILKQRYEAVQTVATSDYTSPNWGYEQAHKNGRMQELQDLFKILP